MNVNKILITKISENDIDDLFEFRKKILPQNSKQLDRGRWDWLYRQNKANKNDVISTWVLRDGSDIVGSISPIPLKLKIGSKVCLGAFGSDYFVDKRYLGLPSLRLLKAMQKEYEINIGANLSLSAAKLFQKMGYVDLSGSIRTATAFFPTNKLGVVSLSSFVKFYFFKLKRFFLCPAKYSIRVTDNVPKSAQNLWERIESYFSVSLIKDYKYLKWRYEDCPAVNYKFLLLEEKQQMVALAAVALLRNDDEETRGLISDILVDYENTSATYGIIRVVLDYFQSVGCTSCSTELLNSRILNSFQFMGFNISDSSLGMMVLLSKKNNQDLKDLTNPDKWTFWIGDTDRF